MYEITILSYFRIALLSLLTPSNKMCNPPTKKKAGGGGGAGIFAWTETESFRSQSDFPGVQTLLQHMPLSPLSGELAAAGATSADQLAANPPPNSSQ